MTFTLSFDFAYLLTDHPPARGPASQGGIYAVYDHATRELIYIGWTTQFRHRLGTYRDSNAFAGYPLGVFFGFAPIPRPPGTHDAVTPAGAAYEALLRDVQGSILSGFNPLPAENDRRPDHRLGDDIAVRGGFAWDSLLYFPANGYDAGDGTLSVIPIPKRR